MTRVNTLDPKYLLDQHLLAEYKEITRIFGYSRDYGHRLSTNDIPNEYVLGTGHVKFFSNKLKYCLYRYKKLQLELIIRGFHINPVSLKDLCEGIDKRLFEYWTPGAKARITCADRIIDRLTNTKAPLKYKSELINLDEAIDITYKGLL